MPPGGFCAGANCTKHAPSCLFLSCSCSCPCASLHSNGDEGTRLQASVDSTWMQYCCSFWARHSLDIHSQLYSVAFSGKTCCVYVWCGVVWCGVVWCGVAWCGVVWCVLTHGVSASGRVAGLPGRYAMHRRAAAWQGLQVNALGRPWKPMGRVRVRWGARRWGTVFRQVWAPAGELLRLCWC